MSGCRTFLSILVLERSEKLLASAELRQDKDAGLDFLSPIA
jgi:hypothetical protein